MILSAFLPLDRDSFSTVHLWFPPTNLNDIPTSIGLYYSGCGNAPSSWGTIFCAIADNAGIQIAMDTTLSTFWIRGKYPNGSFWGAWKQL